MADPIQIRLQGEPPAWATGEQAGFFSYFENEHGEQWVAKVDGKELVFSGLDIGWREIRLAAEEARAALSSGLQGQVGEHRMLMLEDTIVNRAEAMWMAAVISAALPRMGR